MGVGWCVRLKKIQKCLRAEPIITLKRTQHALCIVQLNHEVHEGCVHSGPGTY